MRGLRTGRDDAGLLGAEAIRTDGFRPRRASTNIMRATNLENQGAAPVQDWASVTAVLDSGFTQIPDSGGPNRFTTWLATLNADGSPHVTAVGAIWIDGAFWFQTGDPTRKAKNMARDPRCSLSVSAHEFDLVIEGTAEKVT